MPKGERRVGGRPSGSGHYGEKTQALRVPVSVVAEIQAWLSARHADSLGLVPLPFDSSVSLPLPGPLILRRPLVEDRVAAGFPSPAEDHVQEWLDLNELLVPDKEATFFVRVKAGERGESMLDEGIFPGDILVVSRAREAVVGDIIIGVLDGEFTVKKLVRHGGRFALESANPRYPLMEIKEGQEFSVWGIVTASIHQHGR